MHLLTTLTLPVLLLLLGVAPFAATEEAGEDAVSPLQAEMEAVNDAFRDLRMGLRKDKPTAELIAAVDLMRTHSLAAKQHLPPMIAGLPKAEQHAATEAYQKRMDQVVADLDALEAALTAGDTAKVDTLIDALSAAKKEGHDRFIPEE